MRDSQAGRSPWALFALAVACTGTPAPPRLTVVGSPRPPPRRGPPPCELLMRPRLDLAVRAEHASVELLVDPRQERFSGVMELDLMLGQRTQQLWLHGAGMRVQGASVSSRGSTRPARPLQHAENFLGFVLERPVGPGPVKLRVAWQGSTSLTASSGLLRREEGGRWYAWAQPRPGEAPRVIPTLGEASLQVPCRLTLRMPLEARPFSEWPVASEEVGPDGLRTVRFRPTALSGAPLGFAVGPAQADGMLPRFEAGLSAA